MKSTLLLSFLLAASVFCGEPRPHKETPGLNRLPPVPFKPRDPKDPAVSRGQGAVRWKPWSVETLAEAQKSNKLIMLFITPAWNHWGQVMERSTFTDLEVATRLNEEFIPIRINRDERPDIDIRLQTAVQAMFGVRGWPLTVFLTPKGEPFYGGTYFPAEDDPALEKTGLQSVIQFIMQTWRQNPDLILKQAQAVDEALRQPSNAEVRGAPPADVADRVVAQMSEQLDRKAGGFITPGAHEGAKFPAGPALELASEVYERTHDKNALEIVTKTMDGMLNGAIYDQIGGGFYRATSDRWWRQPKFEKLLTVNAEILSALAAIKRLKLDDASRDAAASATARLWSNTLSVPSGKRPASDDVDPEQVYFYGSQAAGRNGLEEGDYYTWTVKDIEAIFDDMKAAAVKRAFGITEQGNLPQTAPGRNVLCLASAADVPPDAKSVMLSARNTREAPPIDKNVYVDANAAMAEALLRLDWKQRGLKTIDVLLKNAIIPDKDPATFTVAHVLNADGSRKGTLSLPQDMAALASACVTAFEVTHKPEYLEKAEALLRELDRRYWDKAQGGYFDRDMNVDGEPPFLRWPIKVFQDTSELNANGPTALASVRLALLTGKAEHEKRAQAIINAFGKAIEKLGPYGARLCLAAEYLRKAQQLQKK